jgi:hypothetical protein
MSGQDRGKDPGAETASLAEQIRFEVRHPAGVALKLFTGTTIGYRDGGSMASEAELGDGEPAQGRITDRDILAPEELCDLRQAQVLVDEPLDESLVWQQRSHTSPWGLPVSGRSSVATAITRESFRALGPRSRTSPWAWATARYRLTVFASNPSCLAMRFFGTPLNQRRRTSLTSSTVTSRYAMFPPAPFGAGRVIAHGSRRGGNAFEKLQFEGGNGSEKISPEGSHTFENLQLNAHPGTCESGDRRNEMDEKHS